MLNYSTNPLFNDRVNELIDALIVADIPHETQFMCNADGYIVYFPNIANRRGDVILHNYGYGHEWGGFEGYQDMSTVPGDVCVFDTVEEVVEHAKKQNFKRKENDM